MSTPAAPPDAVLIRAMTSADIAATARLQCEGLPRSFVAQLGLRFLRGLHAAFLTSPYSLGLVAVAHSDPGTVLAFALGSSDARAHAAHVLRTGRRRLLVLGALSLATRLHLLPRFLHRRAGRYARRVMTAGRRRPAPGLRTVADPVGPVAVLTTLVVAPRGRGQGTGTTLAEAFTVAAGRAGSAAVMLVTRADEAGAAAFWKRLGWQEVDVHQNLDGELVASMSRGLP